MDKAGTAGLDDTAVSTMSKHNTDKIRRYMPELHAEVMKVMAGFQPNEEYYVPRCLLEMPWNAREMVQAVFPRYNQWILQQQSPDGDDSDAAKNFLYETLPFLALVALQDGIYWIRDYPNNSASIMLRNTFPGYERWASEARKQVETQQATLEESRVAQMEAATQASFHVLRREIQQARNEAKEEREEQRQQVLQLQREIEERDTLLQQLLMQQGEQPMSRQQNALPLAPLLAPTHRRPIQVPAQRNALDNLRSSERLPEIPTELPKTMFELLIQHQQCKLNEFDLAKKTHWPQPLRLRFSKRSYLYKKIRARAERYQGETKDERMRRAAAAMDIEKGGGKTLNAYMQILKKSDPNTKTRAPRRNRNEP
jgi:hypothetical protein